MRRKFYIRNSAAEPRRAWLEVAWNQADAVAHIHINGQIGKSWYDDSGTSHEDFKSAMDEIPAGKKIKIHINSEGGSVQDGLGIYNCIKDRADDCTACIDGYACSIASVIPLAAAKVVSPKSSIWMIHKASAGTYGNEEDHRQSADMLKAHDETIVGLYAEKTGQSKTAIRDAMDKETWMTGEEALDYGLADEMDDSDVSAQLKNFPAARFQHCPERFKAVAQAISAPVKSAETTPPTDQKSNLMNKAQILALLKTHGVDLSAEATEIQILDALGKLAVKPAATAANPEAAALKTQMDTITVQLQSERKARIAARVNKCVEETRIVKDQCDFWIEQCVKDEAVILKLEAMPQTPTIPAIGAESVITNDRFLEIVNKAEKSPAKRFASMKADWKELVAEAGRRDLRSRTLPGMANTYSATLVTAFLMDGAMTNLQNRWAMLKAFSLDFSVDPYKPLATGELKHVTVGATAQTNATNFESGDSTVAPISVAMNQYTVSFQVSNSDLNNGLRMENLVVINTANFANKVIEAATTPITATNFTGTVAASTAVVQPAANFSFSDLAVLQGALKKSPIKNLILDGAYIARIANTPGFFQLAGVVGGNTDAWKAFGWDMIASNSDWTGAGANVFGFACHPQAVVGITGLPLIPPNIPGGILEQQTATVPELEVSYAVHRWFNPSTRTMWCSYDIMAGFIAGDTTAGFLVTSQ